MIFLFFICYTLNIHWRNSIITRWRSCLVIQIGASVENYLVIFFSDLIMVCISLQRLERCCVIYFTLMALINGFLKSKGRLQSYVKCSGRQQTIKYWEKNGRMGDRERKGCGLTRTLFWSLVWQRVWLVDGIRLMWLVAVLQFPVIDSINKTDAWHFNLHWIQW